MLNISGLKLPMIGDELVTGNVYFVDSGANGANDGNLGIHPENSPLATVDGGINMCTANNGDWVVVMPGHAETTSAIAADIAGMTICGVGHGRVRPTLTASTAASDLIDVTAANVRIKNMRLVGAASGVTSLISVGANDFICEGSVLEQAATPLIGVIVTGGIDRFRFSDCLFLGTAAGPNAAIDLQGSGNCVDWVVERCDFNYESSAGLDEAGIRSDKTDTGVRISDCRFLGMDATAIDFNSSSTGLIERVSVLSNNATVAEIFDAGLVGFVDCKITYDSVSGVQIPVTTATA